jgi:predicted metal-dependent phosphoesterase TrpH
LKLSTTDLVLAPDASIDLQVHTNCSDGTWTPEQLIDHLASEGFGLAAITDHDRVETVATLQQLAAAKNLPVLVAVEMTTSWNGEMRDVLCYGFDPEANGLADLAQDVLRRQQENTREVFDYLLRNGYTFPQQAEKLQAILEKPSAQQINELVAVLKQHGYGTGEPSVGKILKDAGFSFAMSDTAAVVNATHQSGGVCLIAHPGRVDFIPFDVEILDQFRQEIPIDGLEVYYPAHTPEQTEMYLVYAQKHGLLTSSGSDSHGPDRMPIKYRAELSRNLLERVGIQVN